MVPPKFEKSHEIHIFYHSSSHSFQVGATEARIDVDGSGAIESEEFIVPLSRWVTWLGIYPAPGLIWSTQGSYS